MAAMAEAKEAAVAMLRRRRLKEAEALEVASAAAGKAAAARVMAAAAKAAGTASELVEALELAIAAWVGMVPKCRRTKAEGQSPEGPRMAWMEAPMGVEIGVAAGVSGKAAALMGTMEAVTMG
jgi:hypothetical protein